jgi:serine protease Do
MSGILVSAEGHVVTSLYNLTNTACLSEPQWRIGRGRIPEDATLTAGIDAIERMRVHMPDGSTPPARLVAWHEGLGVALLKADLEGPAPALLEPAPDSAFVPGRFVLALGSPYGADRLPDPLLTVGVLSKRHADDACLHGPLALMRAPWAGAWQTDAGVTDATCGGAAVDLEGRLLGMLQIWSPLQHGRFSGIAFVEPWPAIEAVLPQMKEGRVYAAGFLGIEWKDVPTGGVPVIGAVLERSAASAAGLAAGDVISAVNGTPTRSVPDVAKILGGLWSGDEIVLTIERGRQRLELRATLGRR